MAKVSEILLKRLLEIQEISDSIDSDEAFLERTNASSGWLSQGAFSWTINHKGLKCIGSQFTMSQCLKAEKLEVYWNDDLRRLEINPK